MKNGTWRLEIYRPDAPRIRKVFKTRQEARKYETIFRGEIEKGNPDILDTFNKVLKGEISKEEPVANKKATCLAEKGLDPNWLQKQLCNW